MIESITSQHPPPKKQKGRGMFHRPISCNSTQCNLRALKWSPVFIQYKTILPAAALHSSGGTAHTGSMETESKAISSQKTYWFHQYGNDQKQYL